MLEDVNVFYLEINDLSVAHKKKNLCLEHCLEQCTCLVVTVAA